MNTKPLMVFLGGLALGYALHRPAPAVNATAEVAANCPSLTAATAGTTIVAAAAAPVAVQPVKHERPSQVADAPGEPPAVAGRVAAAPAPAAQPEPQESLEEMALEVMHRPFPHGEVLTRQSKDNGTQVTNERLDDGSNLDRAYNAAGTLARETLSKPSGERISRAYDESGLVRALSWERPGQGQTDIKLNESGSLMGQMETLPNGDRIVSNYDSAGHLTERWQIRPNGARTKL